MNSFIDVAVGILVVVVSIFVLTFTLYLITGQLEYMYAISHCR